MQDTPKTTALLARTLYPEPVQAQEVACAGSYCVLGALNAMAQGVAPETLPGAERFPASGAGADVLRALNPALPVSLACDAARMIMEANDGRQFDRAWCWAHRALSHEAD